MCDTLVAVGSATADGSTLFAKNSDRPALECQVLEQRPALKDPPARVVRCTHREIPQASEVLATIGSRPYWMWGYEHGMNGRGVVIGNEAIYTKDRITDDPQGLLGMDLVRLGLERGRTAREAFEIIVELLARFGQGGWPSVNGTLEPYDNSFIIADSTEAWVLETAGRRWVAKRVKDGVYAISNLPTIEADFDECSDDLIEHASRQGWWRRSDGDFKFAAAYGDYGHYPIGQAAPRCARSRSLLEESPGQMTPQTMIAVLRDHYEGTALAPARSPSEPDRMTICMHPLGPARGLQTAASMVAHLPRQSRATYWGSLLTPCLGCFLPYFIEGELPPALSLGGATAADDSPWWQFKLLHDAIREPYRRWHPQVRRVFDAEEQRGLSEPHPSQLSQLMSSSVLRMMDALRELRQQTARDE